MVIVHFFRSIIQRRNAKGYLRQPGEAGRLQIIYETFQVAYLNLDLAFFRVSNFLEFQDHPD